MLNGGAKVAAVDAEGNTALIRAAMRGHADLVRRLAVAGIAVSVSNDAGHTALEAALLAEVCADPYVETLEELIRAGADVNRAGVDGRRPKELALAGRCGGIVSALERAGAR
jgi:ankyrin repeat protein